MRLMLAAAAFNPVPAVLALVFWLCRVFCVRSRILALSLSGISLLGMFDVRSENLRPQCNAGVMHLRKLNVIFVETLCTVPEVPCTSRITGRSAYAIRRGDEFASMSKTQQRADAFRGRGMAAQQTHRIILACSQRQDR